MTTNSNSLHRRGDLGFPACENRFATTPSTFVQDFVVPEAYDRPAVVFEQAACVRAYVIKAARVLATRRFRRSGFAFRHTAVGGVRADSFNWRVNLGRMLAESTRQSTAFGIGRDVVAERAGSKRVCSGGIFGSYQEQLGSARKKKSHPQPLHEIVEGSHIARAAIPLADFREGLGVGSPASLRP